jgi:prepilin-type N-terminal cleavage/methylation domain-containing protein
MKRKNLARGWDGFTIVEITISTAILLVVSLIAYAILVNSTTLLAKNISLNESNLILRSALDRVYSEINQANGLPKLINADGSSAPTNGPAAGIIFDRYLGGPYVVTNPGATGLASSAVSLQMKRSTDSLASPPIPKLNDVIRIGTGTIRPMVSSCTADAAAADLTQSLNVSLKTSLGVAIPWTATTQKTASLLHREAFVVVPVNGRGELRFYKDAETVANYNDATGYVVLNREIGTKTIGTEEEDKPFTIVAQSGVSYLNITMRVEGQTYNRALSSRQAQEFNTFLRVDTMLRPRYFF